MTVEQVPHGSIYGPDLMGDILPSGMKDRVMVMGDIVLFEDEVNPVMSVALDTGLEVTALHNHFFFDEPKVYFMHIGGRGSCREAARRRSRHLRYGKGNSRGECPAVKIFRFGPLARQKLD